MRLGKMLSVGEVVEQAPVEDPQAPTRPVESVESVKSVKETPVATARVDTPVEPAVAHLKG